jgi:5-carboxymethyl-2-hydroxymuconate isomerase
MHNSIQHFMELGVKKIEKVVESFMNDEGMNIGEFVLELGKPLQELQREIVAETIEEIDEVYRKSAYRADRYVIERSGVPNTFISTCGEIKYKRTYFESKETGEYLFLADQACGITKNMRKSEDVVIEAITHAVDSSYRISGEYATNTDDIISKQAVMKDIHALEVPALIPQVKKKKQVKVLYINADEDHVSLQFNKKKGDLRIGTNGYKSNTIEPRLACIFEAIEKESKHCKRNRLVGKHYFAGVYKNVEDIWEEVLEYIDTVYDEDYLEAIYIMGDGAAWIKAGLDVLGAKCHFVLDKFHLNQAIMRAIGHLEDSVDDARSAIYDAISFEDKGSVSRVFEIAREWADSDNKKEQIRRSKVYIDNHWEAIIRPNSDEYARMGCSAEGHVSHVLSSRLSSRPLGWSETGVSKMAKLRAYVANKGKVCDLLKYKKERQERVIQEEIRKEVDKQVKKKQKIYTDVWRHETVAGSTGLVNGMYCLTKKLRGICG